MKQTQATRTLETLLASYLCLTAAVAWAEPIAAKTRSFRLEPLEIDKDFSGGCGCSVQRDGATIFFSDLKDKAPGVIKIEGKKHRLKCVGSTAPVKPKAGDHFTKSYAKGALKLRLNFTVLGVCAPTDESCEVTSYEVNTKLESGPSVLEETKLKADCGC